MKRLEYELEFITPAFIGGAYPEKAELRPASIVGMLRWWFRALWASDNTKKLYEEETGLFGGHKEDGSVASHLFIRVKAENVKKGQDIKQEYRLNWGFDSKIGYTTGQHAGIAYLLHSANRRHFIKLGSSFHLQIGIIGISEYQHKLLEGTLWCFFNLGSLGHRSRRGFGNLSVIRIDGDSSLDFFPKEPLSEWIYENLQKIYGFKKPNCVKKYSNIFGSRIVISESKFATWTEALNDIGSIYQAFRKKNKSQVFKAGAFGLPIVHRNKSTLKAEKHDRRASPLIIRIIRVGQHYRWICIWLSGEFLPSGEKLILLKKGKVLGASNLEKDLLIKFWKNLKKYGQEITVGGSPCNTS